MTFEKLRVAVIRGGDTPSYESSLKTGESVLKVLREREDRYMPVDIFIDRAGVWHVRGLPADPDEALKHIDLAWNLSNALLPEQRIEQYLESLRIPHIGSGAVATALAGSIRHSREIYERADLPTMRYALLSADTHSDADTLTIFRTFVQPVIVRMPERGHGFGVKMARTYKELQEAVRQGFEHGKSVLVEEYMKGKEALVAVLEHARGEKRYTTLPAEVRDGHSIAPGNFSPSEKKRMEELARAAHDALGLRHYSAHRFLVTPRKVYILETETIPHLTSDSPLQKSLHATGWKERELVDHLVEQALK